MAAVAEAQQELMASLSHKQATSQRSLQENMKLMQPETDAANLQAEARSTSLECEFQEEPVAVRGRVVLGEACRSRADDCDVENLSRGKAMGHK